MTWVFVCLFFLYALMFYIAVFSEFYTLNCTDGMLTRPPNLRYMMSLTTVCKLINSGHVSLSQHSGSI